MVFNISRYRKQIQRQFDVEVVTPMFLGGANVGEAELRTPSLKGMLRFWWRATCGIGDIHELKEEESKFFGDTSQKAPFSVHVESINNAQPELKNLPKGELFPVKKFKVGIIDYLGFGLRDTRNYLRWHYPAGTRFKVHFTFPSEALETEILNAFRVLVYFGGLGARSRNGFGSLALNDGSQPSITFDGPVKPFSSTSRDAELFLTQRTNFSKWEDALSAIGMVYKDARLSLERKHLYEKRLLVAKPIVQGKGNSNERHAKPYFLHVGKRAPGYYGQILFLPYQYMSGSGSYSKDIYRQYREVCEKMNQIIKEKLPGGAK